MVSDFAKQQAENLAKLNRAGNDDILQIFWFPDESEIRFVETTKSLNHPSIDYVAAFHFPPSPQDGIKLWSATALINHDEIGQLRLPDGWCGWDDAILI